MKAISYFVGEEFVQIHEKSDFSSPRKFQGLSEQIDKKAYSSFQFNSKIFNLKEFTGTLPADKKSEF